MRILPLASAKSVLLRSRLTLTLVALVAASFAALPCGAQQGAPQQASSVLERELGEANRYTGKTLVSTVTVNSNVPLSGVALAVDDLASDLQKVLGTAPRLVDDDTADIVIRLDDSLGSSESYRIDVTASGVGITGADELGVIYGIYRFSNQFLGVDPYWYFKDLAPKTRQRISLAIGTVESEEPRFRYRGWFVNDEDLLTEWKDGGGVRHISYPFYRQVVQLDVLDRVFEALLRAGGNLIIPASFVDVMNEPEANLVRRAAQRGLYVSQHHIEPLGVSHYGFENYWKAKGHEYSFAYGSHPERVREAWRAFATRWRELAGDRVVWQLGLRGKGDRAIWDSDESVDRSTAGKLISQAIAEQWEIVRSVDPRPTPPATTTLWLEGSKLMSEGNLTFPKCITIVFCDHGPSQRMQADFYSTPRTDEFNYGAYYHIGFWSTGPHLLQGSTPQRIRREFDLIAAKGDTDYAIINVCNVREHILGIQAATELMIDANWIEAEFWDRFAPRVLHGPYQALLSNLFPIDDRRIMQDGALFAAAKKMLAKYVTGQSKQRVLSAQTADARTRQLTNAIAGLEALIADYPAEELTANQRVFYDIHFLTQAQMLRELYAFYRALIEAEDDPSQLAEAEAALRQFLTVRKAAATGKWVGWYRGDKKVNVPALLERTRAAQRALAPQSER